MDFKSLMGFVMSEKCYKTYFYDFNFLDVSCFSAVLSKMLGYAIVLGAVLVKVPQIQKVVVAKNAAGISFMALLLEIHAVTSMFTYSLAKGFPFSTWGDSFFILLQNIVLGYLVQHYSGSSGRGVIFVLLLVSIIFVLTSPLTSVTLLTALQASNLPAVVISKLTQAYNNYRNRSTGQLSAITVFLVFVGSLTRIFTSIQETGDRLVIINYVVSSACNGILAFQMLWYWNAAVTVPKHEKKE